MNNKSEIDPSSPNSDHVNRLETIPEDRTNAQVKLDLTVPKVSGGYAPVDLPKEEMPKAEKSQTKSGGWFAKPPVRKDYIQPAPTAIPMKLPLDFHQTWPIDTASGEGVVYTIKITHPDQKEAKTYVVHPDVVNEAVRRCAQGDYTFSILTDKSEGLGGEIRALELHPWVTKIGQFGLFPLKRPIIGSTISEAAYENSADNIAKNQGNWARRTRIENALVAIPLPPDAEGYGDPRWPKMLVDGDWETIITRAFENRWIKSLDDKAARSLAGLE